MNNLEYAISSSTLPFEFDSSDMMKIEDSLPSHITLAISQADTHEEQTKAFDLVTDYVSNNWKSIFPELANKF